MLNATGVKTECMKEDNDIEKQHGFLKKTQTISGEAVPFFTRLI